LPPEYCSFGQKDSSACKLWLRDSHPVLYKEIYGEDAEDAGDGKVKTKADGEEQKAGESGVPEEGQEGEPQQKA
jgi:hypothetical protein